MSFLADRVSPIASAAAFLLILWVLLKLKVSSIPACAASAVLVAVANFIYLLKKNANRKSKTALSMALLGLAFTVLAIIMTILKADLALVLIFVAFACCGLFSAAILSRQINGLR